MWHEIKTEEDVANLMFVFGEFHDGYLKECRYSAGGGVNKDLSMYPINTKRSVLLLIQRQYENPAAIELEFLKVKEFILRPASDKYTEEIHSAAFFFYDGYLYWADDCDFERCWKRDKDDGPCTWICAESARWRAVDHCLGKEDFYMLRPPESD